MVTIAMLWLPILLSAIAVWFASFLIWAVLPIHKSDYKSLPDEDAARNALTPQDIPAGQYSVPHVIEMSQMKEPDNIKKFEEGPVAFITVLPKGIPGMGGRMVMSMLYYLVMSVIVAYITSRTLAAGTDYLAVFRVAGTVAWFGYGMAIIPDAIWFGRPWSSTVKILFDALIYGLLTAGFFGWLWPQ